MLNFLRTPMMDQITNDKRDHNNDINNRMELNGDFKRCENLFIIKRQKPTTVKSLSLSAKNKFHESKMQSPLTENHRRLFIEDVMCLDPKKSAEHDVVILLHPFYQFFCDCSKKERQNI